MGRVIYFPFHATQQRRLPGELRIDSAGVAGNGKRLPYFSDLKVEFPKGLLPTGQFCPYEIYGDVFGQRLIPEDVGNVQPYLSEQVLRTQTIDDLLRILRRNRVLRDVWGSLFVHPLGLFDRANEGIGRFPGDTAELERLIRSTRELGYEFVNLKQWMKRHERPLRPNPIETELPGVKSW
jgi:hypothetical protein